MINKIKKEISEAIIPCFMLSLPIMLGVVFACIFELFIKTMSINWVIILGLAAMFFVGIVIGIWIDNDREYPAEW